MFFEKGKRRLADLGHRRRARGAAHPWRLPGRKPSALSEILIGQSTSPGDLVVDPFMGSGSSGVAALKLGRRYAGNDVSDDSLKLARERLLVRGGVKAQSSRAPEHPEPVQQRLALG